MKPELTMNKITTSLLVLISLFFIGCGNSDSTPKTAGMTGVFEGYIDSPSGAPRFGRAYVVNDKTVFMQHMDENDTVTVLPGTVSEGNITFGTIQCQVVDNTLRCGANTLRAVVSAPVDISVFAGTYTAIDADHNTETMTIDDNGNIDIVNAALPSCKITGELAFELSGRVPVMSLSKNGCEENNDNSNAVAAAGNLDPQITYINLLNPDDRTSTYWFKR
jgi:hypothetical protein